MINLKTINLFKENGLNESQTLYKMEKEVKLINQKLRIKDLNKIMPEYKKYSNKRKEDLVYCIKYLKRYFKKVKENKIDIKLKNHLIKLNKLRKREEKR